MQTFTQCILLQEEAAYKLLKVVRQQFGKGGVPYIATHDGRTIRYPDPDIKVCKCHIRSTKRCRLPQSQAMPYAVPMYCSMAAAIMCSSSGPDMPIQGGTGLPLDIYIHMWALNDEVANQVAKSEIGYMQMQLSEGLLMLAQVNDTIMFDIETGKIKDFIKFDVGQLVMITGGHNQGRVGTIVSRQRHKGSFDIILVKDSVGHEFATR